MITDRLYRSLARVPPAQRLFRRVVRRLPSRRRLVEHFGCRLEVDPAELHGFYLYYEREYDDPIFAFLEGQLARFERALDVGANIGIYTTFLARHVATVDAFEPEPSVLPRLEANLARNGVTNAMIHRCCVSSSDGTVAFAQPTRTNQGVGKIAAEAVDLYRVPAVSLDSFLRDAAHVPLFIKMDIEGGEWLALQVAREVLAGWAAPLTLLLEVHPEDVSGLGGTVAGLRTLLEEAGHTVAALMPDGPRPGNLEAARFWWSHNKR